MKKEEWKEIKGYEGRYRISSMGRVESLVSRNGYRGFLSQCRRSKNRPYKCVVLYDLNGRKMMSVARLVGKAFCENPKGFEYINHINGIKSDNRSENLEWCTAKGNIKHAWQSGLCFKVFGEKTFSNKLRWNQIEIIRDTYKKGEITQRELSQMFGVNQSTISLVVNRKTWPSENMEIIG